MSTPAILAIFPSSFEFELQIWSRLKLETRNSILALLLFMLWILATDNHHNTIAADYLAVLATRFD
jgi:hypothetical protein